jgi:hypothetical protein
VQARASNRVVLAAGGLKGLQVVLGVALVLLALAPAAAGRTLLIGFTDNAGTLNDLALSRSHATAEAALGAKMVRTGVNWNVVEPRRGRWEWRFYDAFYTAVTEAGLTIMPVLLVTPRWESERPGDMPADPTEYARYVAQVVARYGPGGAFWRAHPELDQALASGWFNIWNEPYLRHYSYNGVSPGRYARLVKAAVKAARAVNPRARFLLEADISWERNRRLSGNWIGSMYAAVPDLSNWFDAVSVHPYSGSGDPTECSSSWIQRRHQFCRVQDVQSRIAAHGAAKPLWITEVGWATCSGASYCVSPENQARFLKNAFDMAARYPFVDALLPYSYQDLDPRIPGDFYGLLNGAGAAKPALESYRYGVRTYGEGARRPNALCDLLSAAGLADLLAGCGQR